MGKKRNMNRWMRTSVGRGEDAREGADKQQQGDVAVEDMETPELVEAVETRTEALNEAISELVKRSGDKADTSDSVEQTRQAPERG